MENGYLLRRRHRPRRKIETIIRRLYSVTCEHPDFLCGEVRRQPQTTLTGVESWRAERKHASSTRCVSSVISGHCGSGLPANTRSEKFLNRLASCDPAALLLGSSMLSVSPPSCMSNWQQSVTKFDRSSRYRV